jgi:hypothetical protein
VYIFHNLFLFFFYRNVDYTLEEEEMIIDFVQKRKFLELNQGAQGLKSLEDCLDFAFKSKTEDNSL